MKISAPGRLDFLNTHQDYKGLPVVSAAVNLRTYLEVEESERCELYSQNTSEHCLFELGEPPRGLGFCDYLKAAALAARPTRCLAGVVHSQIPIGGGMASSAALLVAAVAAFLKISGRPIDLYHVAETAYIAEREILGVPCGRLDQYGSAFGHVALIYPKPPVRVEIIPPPGGIFVVLDSGIRHRTIDIHSARQRELSQAVEILNRATGTNYNYWEYPWAELDKKRDLLEILPQHLRDRVLFTIEMQKLTEEGIRILKSPHPDLKKLGEIMTLQHRLLADLYQVSTPELDQLVEKAVEAGALGAKLSGAGLGGVVIALAPDRESAEKIAKHARPARWWIVEIGDGLRHGD